MSKVLLKQTRQFSALSLLLGAFFILSFALIQRSNSANPGSGSLSPSSSAFPWTGSAVGGTSPDEASCVDGFNCDTFTLTLTGSPADWAGKKALVTITAPVQPGVTDYDVFIHKGMGNAGPLVGSAASGGTPPEVVELDPSIPSVGTGVFSVHVVYFAATAADQYTGSASVVNGAMPTPTPSGTPTGTPSPTPGGPNTPRFINHYAPPGVMEDAAEPSNGVNWNSENMVRPLNPAFNPVRTAPGEQTFKTTAINGTQTQTYNGGTSLYYGGVNSFFLRANFDDCSSPAGVQWDQIPLTIVQTARAGFDPILFTDHLTGRTFICQEFALTPAGSTTEITDNDGELLFPSEGGGPSGVDHQTIGGGPFHAPTPPTVRSPTDPNPLATPYPHAVYYASQSIATATNELSLDGGVTFPVQTPLFTASDCAGLHGHVKVAEDGTAYIPDKACADLGVPFVLGGEASLVVSENNGATWDVRQIPGARASGGQDDPSVGVSICPPAVTSTGVSVPCDKAARSNRVYVGFLYSDDPTTTGVDETNVPGIAVSNDKGLTWSAPFNIGAVSGVKHAAFPAVVSGDPDRAAFAFLGTPDVEKPGEDHTGGANDDPALFTGAWYLYVATTFDGGASWNVQNVTPNDPIQRGPICGGGTCRNLLDFMDIQLDKQGRVLVAGQDGCIGSCVNGGSNTFSAKAFLSRQSGGRRMFSIYDVDTAEPRLAGAPNLNGSLANNVVTLSWEVPDNGGSPIAGYNVYRSLSQTGPFGPVPHATVTEPRFVETIPSPNQTFYYVVTTRNPGEGPYCKPFTPSIVAADAATRCVLPGILVNNDVNPDGTNNDAAQNTPVDGRVNVRQLLIAEPFISSGTEQLFFTLQVDPSAMASAPPNSQWLIIWNRQGVPGGGNDADFDRMYVAMRTDAGGTPSFEYGKFGDPLPLGGTVPTGNENVPVKFGDTDAGSGYDPLTGVIRIVVSNSKFREIDGGAATYKAGTDLAATNVRTYFNRPDPGQRSQNNASDITTDATYSLAGNAACAPQAVALVRAFSRKIHAEAGVYDIQLAPTNENVVAIEPRNSGDNTHQVVFVFAQPVTFTDATASPQSGKTASVASTSPKTTPNSEVIVNLSNVSNEQTVTVNLTGVSAGAAGGSPLSATVAFLKGDANSDRRVDAGDVLITRQQNLQPLERDNFRSDVNVDGRIDAGDVLVTRQQNLTSLPPARSEAKESRRAKPTREAGAR